MERRQFLAGAAALSLLGTSSSRAGLKQQGPWKKPALHWVSAANPFFIICR